MTRTATSARVLLVADHRPTAPEPGSTPVRRYRLARLRLDGPAAEPVSRFDHLKRSFD